jgi:hypothetical protein
VINGRITDNPEAIPSCLQSRIFGNLDSQLEEYGSSALNQGSEIVSQGAPSLNFDKLDRNIAHSMGTLLQWAGL